MRQGILKIEKRILFVLAYFDVFDRPLTGFEIWKWLYGPEENISPGDLLRVLEKSEKLNKIIETRDGFYFFRGRSALVAKRSGRYAIADRKFKKAVSIVRILSKLPFIRCIGVCNSVAYSNAPLRSDIDLFVLTAPKRIWTARFFMVGCLKILGLRPSNKKVKDKFCVSFFADEENLCFRDLLFPPDPDGLEDAHFIYWLKQFMPIYDEGAFGKMERRNEWIKRYLPHCGAYEPARRRIGRAGDLKNIMEKIFGTIAPEHIFRAVQMRILPAELKRMAREDDTRVVIRGGLLKFHSNDRRKEYRDKLKQRLKAYGEI